MKKLLSLLLVLASLFGRCSKQEEEKKEETQTYIEPHYNEVEDFHIEWTNLLDQQEDDYYAYVYNVTCSPCSSLREQITGLAKSGKVKIYFVMPSDDIPFTDDLELAESSLGAFTVQNVYCYSTPTLMQITNKIVSMYTRDYSTIKNFLDSFGD